MLPETYDPSFLTDLVYSILQRDRLCGSVRIGQENRREWSKRGWDKSPSLNYFGLLSKTVVEWALLTLISSAFTALLGRVDDEIEF